METLLHEVMVTVKPCFEPTYEGWKRRFSLWISFIGYPVLSLPMRDGNPVSHRPTAPGDTQF